ncbi:MAG: hypothetical protein KDC54_07980, partial [Lewinella sp.]|nr:hypothetical protein [Lewinella sp.]
MTPQFRTISFYFLLILLLSGTTLSGQYSAPAVTAVGHTAESSDTLQRASHSTLDPLNSIDVLDDPFIVTGQGFEPNCRYISPGYVPDGSFSVTIQDGASCPGTIYSITVAPVAGSGPLNTTPPVPIPNEILGQPADVYYFFYAGAGNYEVTVVEVGFCEPENPLEVITVNVPDGEDTIDPIWQVTDEFDNVLADNNPFTIPGLISQVIELDCYPVEQYLMSGFDLCDGLIDALDAVAATATNGTLVSVTPDPGNDRYLIDVSWAPGVASEVQLTGQDAAGNDVLLTLRANVAPDLIDPIWQVTDEFDNVLADNNPFTIPGLNSQVMEFDCYPVEQYVMSGFDLCDGFIDALDAVAATATNGTQVSVTPDPDNDRYLIDVSWAPGVASEVQLTGQDAAGNDVLL